MAVEETNREGKTPLNVTEVQINFEGKSMEGNIGKVWIVKDLLRDIGQYGQIKSILLNMLHSLYR